MEEKEINDNYKNYYEIKSVIGKGRYGKVYKGINKKTKELRAIKVMEIDENEDIFMKHIKNEIKNMKICSNNNNNSVKIFECFRYKDELVNEFVIIMELCDSSLQKILDEKKEGFTCEEIFNIMNQLNNTFRIMNKEKIVHRDIKLDNIVIKMNKEKKDSNINFTVKLTDYGISKQLINTIGKTFGGTALTMSPEIFEGNKNYDYKCDLWSIGIIIYQLFFKEYPFKGETPLAIYNQIKTFGNKLLKRTKNKNLDNLIDSLLIIDPTKRINYEDYFYHPFFMENLKSQICALKRLKTEFELCKNDKDLFELGCIFSLVENDLFEWRTSMVGPRGTPYENSIFFIKIIFPMNYPKFGPNFRFINKIRHLNVNPQGCISHPNLQEWKTTGNLLKDYGVKQALFDIFSRFYEQDPNDCYDIELGRLYRGNREAFNKLVKKWTQYYASKFDYE